MTDLITISRERRLPNGRILRVDKKITAAEIDYSFIEVEKLMAFHYNRLGQQLEDEVAKLRLEGL